MDYVKPPDQVRAMLEAGQSKALMSTRDTLIRGFMGGALLALAAAFAVTVAVETGSMLVGALLFPVGFTMIYLLGFDLVTGVFTLVPLSWMDRRPGVTWKSLLRNWGLVFVGNLAGALVVALLMAIILTTGFATPPDAVGERLSEIGVNRTLGYQEFGAAGMLTLFVRAVLCNWMVSTGVVAALLAKSVPGKIMAMWLPIIVFFFMEFEHSVVNMFLFPVALMIGGEFSVVDYLVWNEIPTLLGNMVGGFLFVGLMLYFAHYRTTTPPHDGVPATGSGPESPVEPHATGDQREVGSNGHHGHHGHHGTGTAERHVSQT